MLSPKLGWTEVKHDIDDSRMLTFTRTLPIPLDNLGTSIKDGPIDWETLYENKN